MLTGKTVQNWDNWLCLVRNEFKTSEGLPGYLELKDQFPECKKVDYRNR